MRSRTSSASNVDPFPNRAAPRRTPDDPTWHEPPDDRQDGGGSRGAYGVPQYSRAMIFAVWAAAALPMAALAWVVAPAVAGDAPSERRFFLTLLGALTVGLVWQAALVVILMVRERRNDPTWTNIWDRLWLRPPTTEKRRGGRLWWWIAAYGVGLAAIDMLLIGPGGPHDRDFGAFLELAPRARRPSTTRGGSTLWWPSSSAFNTFLGEEMLFRGVLLPRMRAAFGKLDWVVNSFLFGFYHLHEPWVIPNAILTGLCHRIPHAEVPQRLDGDRDSFDRVGVLPRGVDSRRTGLKPDDAVLDSRTSVCEGVVGIDDLAKRRWGLRPPPARVVDVLLATVFLGAVAAERISNPLESAADTILGAVLAAVLAGAIWRRRRFPMSAFVVGTVALCTESLLDVTSPVSPYGNQFVVYCAGYYATRKRSLWAPPSSPPASWSTSPAVLLRTPPNRSASCSSGW